MEHGGKGCGVFVVVDVVVFSQKYLEQIQTLRACAKYVISNLAGTDKRVCVN